MADTLISLQRKRGSAEALNSVVRTMKALAASSIDQYEMAVRSLEDYYKTVTLSLYACSRSQKAAQAAPDIAARNPNDFNRVAIVLGSDQGLVGGFNERLAAFTLEKLDKLSGMKEIWPMGERLLPLLEESGLPLNGPFEVPNAIEGITDLVNVILLRMEEYHQTKKLDALYIFYNAPKDYAQYEPKFDQLLPVDDHWKKDLPATGWPSPLQPEVIGGVDNMLSFLLQEYLFVLLFKACAGSLASENASRLQAMQRAEKNIGDTLDTLKQHFNRLRQSSIDAELFDLVSGFEALGKK